MAVFGLLGEHLSHSFSPKIHAMLADYEYRLFDLPPGEVDAFLRGGDFDGLNVTMPYKKTVIPYCAELSPDARAIGCVNTIVRRPDGTLFGDNTDYYGFSYQLKKTGADLSGKKALILGNGGAAATVRAVLCESGVGEIINVSRGGETNYTNAARHSDAYAIVNTTPVGMYPDNGARLIDLSDFPQCGVALDVIYNPAKTELIMDAEDLGIPASGGMYMLTAQAKRTAELFTGRKIPDDVIDGITDRLTRQTRNILLIGMPGSGKSTAGRRLAELTGRELIDTDEQLVKNAGRSIADILAADGEAAFRALETDALREASKRSGCVIATGGGIVTRTENRRLIRQNSIAVFLERDIAELATGGRPLSISRGVEALYRERLPLYREWGDFTVQVSDTETTVKRIMEVVA